MHPTVTAVVLNYRTPLDAVKCVRSLLNQTIADRMEILAIDNHSEDDSIGTLRNRLRDPRVRILETNRNGGYGFGNNVGIAHARGAFVLVTNPDNELPPTAVEAMLAAMEKDERIGIVAPKLVHEDGTMRESIRAFPRLADVIVKRTTLQRFFPKRMDRYLQRTENPNRERDVDWAVGACLLIRRDLLQSIGAFDERFFLFFEDIDLCRRCIAAGKRVRYLPHVRVSDKKERLSEGGVLRMLRKRTGRAHIASALKYFWKWRGVRIGH